MIFSLLVLIIIALSAWYYYVHYISRMGRLINLIPGPRSIPILGNILDIQLSNVELWNLICKYSDMYYPIFKGWNIFLPIVSIRHPDDVETILSQMKHLDKSFIYKIFEPWFNTGLLTSRAVKWHSRRKLLTPAFHFNILQQFINILIDEGDRISKTLKEVNGPVVKDLVPFISEHTLNAICETAMGTSLKNFGSFQQKYRQAVHEMGLCIMYRLKKPWLYSNLLFNLTPVGFKQRKILQILHGFTEKIITERKLYHERTGGQYLKIFKDNKMIDSDDMEFVEGRTKRLALLDLLIAKWQENLITDFDIREEINTFMFEGHDTTAIALYYALMLFAEHEDIQDRARAEINSVIQQNGERFTMASLQKLQYLDRCLKESLRLYPSVHLISRITSEDTKLQSFTIPANTTVHLNIFQVHRDPNFWPNPDVFDPDRFLPEKSQNRHPYCYLPFSAGPRNCIGQRFALLEMKAIVAPLLYNFYLQPIDYLKDLRISIDLVMRPEHPLRLKFIPVQSVQPSDMNKNFVDAKA